jgi:hypothetical protein
MRIDRTGECPPFLDYVTQQVILPHHGALPEAFQALTKYGNYRWIDIPSYQRGLVWDAEKLEVLLESDSILLGNAVLGKFEIPHRDEPPFSNLPDDSRYYEILIDGLQRFSIGTALMEILFELVFSQAAEYSMFLPEFTALYARVGTLGPVYHHNHFQLSNHPRNVVSGSYCAFYDELRSWVRRQLGDPGEVHRLVQQMLRLFLTRQISPDTYHGFKDEYDVTNTFIGLNTTRVQLHVVDWLRSILIELGGRARWTPGQIGEIENRFSDVFYSTGDSDPIKELEPFAAICKTLLVDGRGLRHHVFPSLHGTGKLSFSEVERWLSYVDKMFAAGSSATVNEIRQCGALPFTCLLTHYYRLLLSVGAEPSFLDGGELEASELLVFLRGIYRVAFDGRIGRIGIHAEQLLYQDLSLSEVADRISLQFLGIELDTPVTIDWLKISLRKADRRRAQRVFNACLLPEHGQVIDFAPYSFGREADRYQIDHLIPKVTIKRNDPGSVEAESIVNFAPIRTTTNNSQNHLRCSEKLRSGGTFSREIEMSEGAAHPYVVWLVDEQGGMGIQLDYLKFLEPNAVIPVGDQRLSQISNLLVSRL